MFRISSDCYILCRLIFFLTAVLSGKGNDGGNPGPRPESIMAPSAGRIRPTGPARGSLFHLYFIRTNHLQGTTASCKLGHRHSGETKNKGVLSWLEFKLIFSPRNLLCVSASLTSTIGDKAKANVLVGMQAFRQAGIETGR